MSNKVGKKMFIMARLYSKVWPMLSIFDSNKQKTPLEISEKIVESRKVHTDMALVKTFKSAA
jgi:hypothetical protein